MSEMLQPDTLTRKAAPEEQDTSFFQYLLHLLLPPTCQLCKTPLPSNSAASDLCPSCTDSCIIETPSACPVCAEPYAAPMFAEHQCIHCIEHPPDFSWLKTIGIHTGELKHAIHELKYSGRFNLAQPLARLLLQRLHAEIYAFAPQTIIPVPLHRKRLRRRGFNQSQLVARHLGRAIKVRVNSRYLLRSRATTSQTDLTRQQRQHNLKGAFTLNGSLTPQRILLVDDVVTTTATCRECAITLTKAGHEVAVAALGRARLQH